MFKVTGNFSQGCITNGKINGFSAMVMQEHLEKETEKEKEEKEKTWKSELKAFQSKHK